MANSSQPAQQLAQLPSTPLKSVWKRFNETSSVTAISSHSLVNGNAEDSHEKESVSSKDAMQGENSEHEPSTSTSSVAGDTQISSAPHPPPAPAYRPAPLPPVNPWKVRQEEIERKRWKESQDAPPAPLQMDRIVPKPPANVPAKFANKPNGAVKSEGDGSSLLSLTFL